MSSQRIYQLLVSFTVITAIAFVSEKSRVMASVLSVMPVTITLALWFVSTGTNGDTTVTAGFTRMVLLGLIPTALFVVACWLGFQRGWPLWRVLAVGYAVWMVAMGLYRLIHAGLARG